MIFETGDENASLGAGCTLSLSQRLSPTTIAQSRTRGGSKETFSVSPMLFTSTGAGAPQLPSRIGSNGATSVVTGASACTHCMPRFPCRSKQPLIPEALESPLALVMAP
jgi:hypothetical protein